jgi:hypothetical protein
MKEKKNMKKTKTPVVPFEYNQKQVYMLMYCVGELEANIKTLSKQKNPEAKFTIEAINKAIDALAVEYTRHLDALVAGNGQDDNFAVVEMFSRLKFK